MQDSISDDQARVYLEQADAYDELIMAEDADGRLVVELLARVPVDGLRLLDVGGGTGRLSRLLGPRASHVHLVDRAAPMLVVARRRLTELGLGDRVTIHEADARALPLADASVDLATAGWVFGHFRTWMPDGWKAEVDQAIAELHRVVVPGGSLVIIETLGTGRESPEAPPGLEDYFDHLEKAHGFTRSWLRTDYRFKDVETAARVTGAFFGEAFATRIRARGVPTVPECTALFVLQVPLS